MSACGCKFICLNWIISLKVQKMSWTLDGKIRNNARLSNTSFMRAYSWTSVSLRRLYIGQFPPLHFKDRDEGLVSKGSKDILHENKMFLCTMELPNESASFVVIFVLFVLLSFRTNLWPLFYTKILEKLLFVRQQYTFWLQHYTRYSTSYKHFFFSFCGVLKWESKQNTFCTLG